MPYDIIWQILVVLTPAVIVGELFRQFGLPSVAGELLSGLVLGPTVIGLVRMNAEIDAFSTISLFFIIFLIGFEMNTETLRRHLSRASLLTLTSFVIPLAVSAIIALRVFAFGGVGDFIVALAISVPSISIVSVIVMQYGLLESVVGQTILASVVITDIAAFIFLAAVSQSASNTVLLIIYLIIFIGIYAIVDRILNSKRESFQRVLNTGARYLKSEDISYAILIAAGLLLSLVFQAMGISYILGAFFAGLILHEELIGKEAFGRISRTLGRFNRGFFIPLFFGFAGVQATLVSGYGWVFPLALVVVASVGLAVVLTYFLANNLFRSNADLANMHKDAARQISVILSGRGAVGIIIISVALSYALINNQAYSLVIVATTVISIVTPILLGRGAKQSAAISESP
ncbi:MAG: cation:proton antiporter [Thaumarchaeota archaeon]|nr:cation:proton antiporter [Nitrososphaerota archaeon]MDG7001953.1 cation:proton antiporter [Nitrososphaerota archaeon]